MVLQHEQITKNRKHRSHHCHCRGTLRRKDQEPFIVTTKGKDKGWGVTCGM